MSCTCFPDHKGIGFNIAGNKGRIEHSLYIAPIFLPGLNAEELRGTVQ